MMAIPNSSASSSLSAAAAAAAAPAPAASWPRARARAGQRPPPRFPRTVLHRPALARLALCFGLLLGVGVCVCSSQSPAPETAEARYRRLYEEARKSWLAATNQAEPAWKFAAACFDWAECASNDTQRAEIAQEGISAARRAIAVDPKAAPAHYYLGLDLGQLAQTKLLGALRIVSEMEAAFKRSLELDPAFDYAGAHRSLGMLYRDAPGWPTSLGDRAKARAHLKKAVELSPEYPDNQLTLLETFLKWGEKKSVSEQLPSVEAILRKARGQFAGEAWRFAWQDWEKRWDKIRRF